MRVDANHKEENGMMNPGIAVREDGSGGDLVGMIVATEPDVLDAEIAAARRQVERGLADLVDGSVRLATALVRMRHSGAYRSFGCASFEEYCRTRHGITAETARFYMAPLETLGAETYRALVRDYGQRRAYYLAEVYRLDPQLFTSLTTPTDGATAVGTVQHLETMVADLRRQVQEACAREQEACAREQEWRQAVVREQALGRTIAARLARLEEVAQTLQQERDRAEQEQRRLEVALRALQEEQADRQVLRARAVGSDHDQPVPPVPVLSGAIERSLPPTDLQRVVALTLRVLVQQGTPEAAAAVWTAAAMLLERRAWGRPVGVPPLAVMAQALRRLAQEAIRTTASGTDGSDHR